MRTDSRQHADPSGRFGRYEGWGNHSQMTGNVGEIQIFWAQELDGRSLEKSIVLLAHVSGVLDRFMADIMDVLETV